jgi:hypothetical protein
MGYSIGSERRGDRVRGREEEGGMRNEEGGRRKEEGGRRKEEGGGIKINNFRN